MSADCTYYDVFDTDGITWLDYATFECMDDFVCATTEPGTDEAIWTTLDTSVDGYREGWFEMGTDAYAPCIEWAAMQSDGLDYKLYDDQAMDIATSMFDVTMQPTTYLCWEGRALECQPDSGSGMYTGTTGYEWACIEGGDPSMNPDGWVPLAGVLGETMETFSDKYPHCLPATEVDYAGASPED